MGILIYESILRGVWPTYVYNDMHLLYDVTSKLPSPLSSTGDAGGTCTRGFSPAGTSLHRFRVNPGLQGHHGPHLATHAHTLFRGLPRGGGFSFFGFVFFSLLLVFFRWYLQERQLGCLKKW